MALFQASVLKSHLALLHEASVDKAYKKYQKYFWNTEIQENIKSAKEEQYQATFLNELFVNILGYTLFPNPNYNLTTEFKNEKNQRKADGAIQKDGVAIGVIELKGTNTKDLESIRRQAFDYKANHKDCVYVITSNFEKLRFYINDATEFEEFDLFTLSLERFKLLYLCLYIDKVNNHTPLKIKEASVRVEEEITKAFYKDYSIFKRELFRDLVKRNAKTVKTKLSEANLLENHDYIIRLEKNVKLTLFQKSQKLIDRFLFIFFAEDRMLLPYNSTLQILNKWKDDWDFGDERPLYDLFKQYFKFLDTGRKGTASRAEIYAYNGGLFKPDAILDALEIDNDLLYKYALKLSNYDFESQIDVNILGHIFENSLNEIESVNAEIEGADFDKQTSKRKKDGVFYTPKYITKYIVENTVGKLCEEKKAQLEFKEEEYFKGRKNRNKTTIERLVAILDDYRNWLLQLTICDPACGSGAFLNQALDFLIKEHNYIDELKTKILGGGFQFPDIENTILENNIYGVDLNEESVEIAKLSLWLRTAQPRRKLNDLNSNIKCGNSLIDDKKVAGDKAFKWEKEFPLIFKEKNKKPYHITTTIHDSRTSQRMIDYNVRKNRAMGTKPYAEPVWFTQEEDFIITKIVAEIVKEDRLNIVAFNVCGDHMHILLVCEEDEKTKIVQKIKAKTSKAVNIARYPQPNPIPREHAEFPREHANAEFPREHAPLEERTAKNKPVWSQKFNTTEIKDDTQFYATKKYIENNRKKHDLPEHDQKTSALIAQFICDYKTAFATEYTGGFDVVIGNPPYVNLKEFNNTIHSYLSKNYDEIHTGYNDLMYYFLYKGIEILNPSGVFGVITSNYFIGNDYAQKLRSYLSLYIHTLVNFSDYHIFKDANIHTTIIFANAVAMSDKVNIINYKSNFTLNEINLTLPEFDKTQVERKSLTNNWLIANRKSLDLIKKVKFGNKLLGEITEIAKGSESGKNEIFTIDRNTIKKFNIEKSVLRRCVKNSDIDAYIINTTDQFLIYSDNEFSKEKFPNAYSYLELYKELLLDRRGPKSKEYEWWRLHRPSIKSIFDAPEKLLVPYRAEKNRFGYDNQQFFNNGGDVRAIVSTDDNYSLKFITAQLNSKLLNWFYGFIGKPKGNSREYFNKPLSLIPIRYSENKKEFEALVDGMIDFKTKYNDAILKFQRYLMSNFNFQQLTRKLENWQQLSFGDFIKELNKAIKATNKERIKDNLPAVPELSKKDEFEWMELFEENKKKAQELQTQIAQTEREIDQMVYELYGLTEEEIAIVENS